MSTVPVEQDALDGWARFADEIRNGSLRIRTDVACKRLADAQEKLTEQHLAAAGALISLHRAGAALPADVAPPETTPFHLLDTPATRRLVSLLRAAYEAARAVDRERCPEADDDVEALPIGELLMKWESEVYGPAGRGRERNADRRRLRRTHWRNPPIAWTGGCSCGCKRSAGSM